MTVQQAAAGLTVLVEDHLGLVQQVVSQVAGHFPRHVDRRDLARAGALGLVEAAQRFDASRGVPFERFAARRIRGAILDAVRAVDWAPRSVRAAGRNLEAVEQQLASTQGSSPSDADVAAALGVSAAELRAVRNRVHRAVVLALDGFSGGGGDDDDLSLGDVLADRTAAEPAEELESRELLGYLHDAVALLPDRYREVVVGYFLEGRTSADLAASFGVTESRISQVRSEALALLRSGIEAQYERPAAAAAPGHRGPRGARRQADFATALGCARGWKERLGDGRPALAAAG